MSLTENNVKAELSYAALHAVAAQCGFGCSGTPRHEDDAGVDARIHVRKRLTPESTLMNFHLDVQLKATSQEVVRADGKYSYQLETKQYDKLRDPNVDIPRILVVLLLPADRNEWLRLLPEELVLKGRLRWMSLRNLPPLENLGQQSLTIKLPDDNVLTSESLVELAIKRSKGEWVDGAA